MVEIVRMVVLFRELNRNSHEDNENIVLQLSSVSKTIFETQKATTFYLFRITKIYNSNRMVLPLPNGSLKKKQLKNSNCTKILFRRWCFPGNFPEMFGIPLLWKIYKELVLKKSDTIYRVIHSSKGIHEKFLLLAIKALFNIFSNHQIEYVT